MNPQLANWTLCNIGSTINRFTHPMDMRDEIEKIKELPPLPGSAVDILNLITQADVDCIRLAEIIERDPLMTAQVMRAASSALYGYQGKICSVHDAIIKVLGYEFVTNLVLGMAMLGKLNAPTAGRIGMKAFWVQSLASALLMKQLAAKMPKHIQPNSAEIHAVALLHNIGYPLLGHLFKAEFKYLNEVVEANPNLSAFSLESFSLGVTHCELGAWLMKAWNMPDVIFDVVYHHHNPAYRDRNYIVTLLTYLNDFLLGQLDIGDGINQSCSQDVFDELGLDLSACYAARDKLAEQIDSLFELVDGLIG